MLLCSISDHFKMELLAVTMKQGSIPNDSV